MAISRRRFISAAAATSAVIAVGRPNLLMAQEVEEITVTAFGGVWEQALRDAFVTDFEARTGKRANVLLGGPPQWVSQIEANPDNPPIHALANSVDLGLAAGKAGLVEKLTLDKVPALEHVPQAALDVCDGYGAVIAYSAAGFAYHERLAQPPRTIAELVDGAVAGRFRVTLPGIGYSATPAILIWSFADALGGSVDDVDPAFDALRRMREAGTMFWNGINDPLVQLDSGEADITIYFDGRAWAHHDSGASWMRWISPQEKGAMSPSVIQKVRNAPDLAWEYVQSVLSKGPQEIFGARLNYGMSNSQVEYPPPLDERVVRWEDTRIPPFGRIAETQAEWIERWHKEIAA